MKQTNSAIKFLMAQYRAIFNNAYFKGLATAAVVTAAMAAGQAQAAGTNFADGTDYVADTIAEAASKKKIETASAEDTLTIASGQKFVNGIDVKKDHKLTVKGRVVSVADVNVNGTFTISKSGSSSDLMLTSQEGETKAKAKYKVYDKDFNADGATITLDKANIGAADFNIQNSTLNLVADATGVTSLTAYGEGTKQEGATTKDFTFNANSKLTNVKASLDGATNITAVGNLTIAGDDKTKSEIKLKGNASSGSTYQEKLAYVGAGRTLDISNTTISVSGSASGSGAAVSAQTLNIANSDIKVNGEHDILTLGSIYDRRKAGGDSTVQAEGADNKGKLSIANSNISVGDNAVLNFGAEGTKTTLTISGENTIDNKGTVNFYTKEVSMGAADFTGFVGKKAEFKTAKSVLNVSGDLDLNKSAVIKADGSLDTDKLAVTTKLTLNGESVTLGSAYKADTLDIHADTLKVTGTEGEDKTFTLSSGTLTANQAVTAAKDAVKTFKIAGENGAATLVLGKQAAGTVSNIQAFEVGATSATKPNMLNVRGDWNFGGADVTIAKSGSFVVSGKADNVGDLILSNEEKSKVNVTGNLTAQRLVEGSGSDSSAINVNGSFTLTGDGAGDKIGTADTYKNDISFSKAKVNINAGGTFDVSAADVQDDFLVFTEDEKTKLTSVELKKTASGDIGGWNKDNVALKAGGHLVFDFTGKTMTAESIKNFTAAVANSKAAGIVDIKGVQLAKADLDAIISTDKTTGEKTANLDKIIENNLAGVGIDEIKDLKATVTTANASKMQGSVGAVEAETGSTGLAVEKTLTLNNAASNGGNFISIKGTEGPADIKVSDNAALELNGQGKIGNITRDSDKSTSVVMNATAGKTQIAGTIDAKNLSVQAGTVQAQTVTADNLVVAGNLESLVKNAAQGSTPAVLHDITAKTLDTAAGSVIKTGTLTIGDSGSGTDSVIKGSVEAKNITVANNADNTLSILDGVVKADSLAFSAAGKLFVGQDGKDSASGELDLDTLNLSGGMLILDPEWGSKATIAFINQSAGDSVDVSGSVGVGKNSVFFAGAKTTTEADKAQAQAIVNRFTDANGSLDKDGIGSLFIVNKPFTVDTGKEVIVDPSKTGADLTAKLGKPTANSFTLEAGSALVVTEALTEALIADQTKSAIKFTTSGSASLKANANSSIIFDGNVFAGDKLKLSNANTVTVDANAAISAANGLLNASNASGTLTFALDTKAAEKLYNQSAPVKDLTLAVVKGDYKGHMDIGTEYIHDISGFDGGKAVEGTARLAVYGGAVQGTALAQQAANDAVVERMSRSNPNGSLVFANNAQGGGLWLSPIYKSHESDSFDADGADYGVDGDLTGLVLGADSTTASGVRVGGYFNFGSASFDGQGVGDQVSNDADYFGFGLYAGMTAGQFSLLADAGFTQVSNDIEQSVNYKDYSKLKADVDSTAVTLGLRGEYKLSVATMDVTPHLGVRYTRLNIDSYDAKTKGEVLATSSFDTMQMFSIPFGVSVSKDIAAGAWTLKPVFDLTLTANAGDTDAKMNTTFIGAKSLDLTSEAFDSFTYGATFGLDAKYGENFSIGLNTNYTGSSNADEFGVMGNARYMF